jgi:branched-chain amino acid transport system substrate-binding protein
MDSRRRLAATAIVAAALIMTTSACSFRSDSSSSGSNKPDHYTVTVGTDLSSAFSSACCGIPIANGFKTYLDATNAKGGIDGSKINVQSLDDRADVTTGLANYQQTLSSDSLGYFLTSASTVLTPIAARATKDGIATSSIGGYQGGVGVYPYVYNSLPNAKSYVDTVTQFARTRVPSVNGAKAAFFAYDSTLTETFQKSMAAKLSGDGWQLAYNQLVPSTASDFSVAAGNIAGAGPSVVIVDLLEGQLPTFITQLRARGVTAPVINFSSNIQDSTLAKIDDPKLYLAEFTAPASNTGNKAIAQLQQQAKAANLTQGDENPFFVTGYVQAEVVVAAMKKCAPDCTRTSFNKALGNTTVPGNGLMAGNPGFSQQDHVMVKKLVMVRYDSATKLPVLLPGYGL